MSIVVENGVLKVPGAQDKLRAKGAERPEFLDDYTLIDIETTGLSPYRDRVTELGGIKVRSGEIVDEYSHLVAYDGSNKVPAFITKLNGITEEKIINEGVPVAEAARDFREFIGDDVIIGYNVNFDLNFVYDLAKKFHLDQLSNDYVDVLRLARAYYPRERHNRLIDVMQRAGIGQVEQHRGLDDSIDTKKVYDDFRQNFTDDLLTRAQNKVKNLDLTSGELESWQLGFRNPVNMKNISFTGRIQMDETDAGKMINNMGGQYQSDVEADTNYLIMGDRDFFKRDNPDWNKAQDLNKNGAQIKRLSESFFLNMLDDWARS
ncbi:exonuclease domain-containing protein [Lactobacillus agrestimuris]|uniref:exonuclease domain-containing protein n=1 Tax=Lactobacillus agrestimuris TaxID=2941328 RepID=UPI00204467D6|nr:exonuclease domain-containing protein [Lactobacillus agrestimuris]